MVIYLHPVTFSDLFTYFRQKMMIKRATLNINFTLFLWVLLPFVLSAQTQTLLKSGYKTEQLPFDSIQLIEKKAALYFHNLINEYRSKNQLDTLRWNETLWLTCRNHNLWMRHHSELSHSQKPGTPYFSGKSPGDRYRYTTQNKGTCSWSGENALYNFSANGNTIDKIAENIAKNSIEQWKRSPGHNKNMLGKQHTTHGTSFLLDDYRVWATDLFAYNSDEEQKESIELSDVQQIYKHIEPKKTDLNEETSEQLKKISNRFLKQEIEKALHDEINITHEKKLKSHKHFTKAAQKHAEYMASVKKLSLEQAPEKRKFYASTSRKRLLKASAGLSLLLYNQKKITEQIAVAETEENSIQLDHIIRELKTGLAETKIKQSDSGKYGIGISVKKQKGKILIYVSRILALS